MPKIRQRIFEEDKVQVQCPSCKFIGDLFEAFDVLGADEGKVLCNRCTEEFKPKRLPPI